MLTPRSHFGKRCGRFPLASLAERENPTCEADMAYESFDAFRELLVKHYYNNDGTLFKDEARLVEIFQAFGNRMGSLMMREVLCKSTFFTRDNYIKSDPVQLAALEADKKTAFRFCPRAHRDVATVVDVLGDKFDQIRYMTSLNNPAVAMAIAQTFPYKTPWWLSISVSSHLPTSTHKIIDISQFETNALADMVCTWLRNPERVYRHRIGMDAPSQYESVSTCIVKNALAILYVRHHEHREPLPAEPEIDELLGTRYRKAVEIQSWANKMQVLAGGVDMALPLYFRSIIYTVEDARASVERGAEYLGLFRKTIHPHHRHHAYRILKRRGDTILTKIAQREDLCLIVLPIIVRFILDPVPPRFKPLGKRN